MGLFEWSKSTTQSATAHVQASTLSCTCRNDMNSIEELSVYRNRSFEHSLVVCVGSQPRPFGGSDEEDQEQ